MSDAIDLRRALAAHLEFYRDLGITGVSRDRMWRHRQLGPEPAAGDDVAVDAPVTLEAPLTMEAPVTLAAAAPQGDMELVTEIATGTPAPAAPAMSMARKIPNQAAAPAPAEAPVRSPATAAAAATRDRRDPQVILDEIRTDLGPDCTRCKLCRQGRTQVVFGVGNPSADLMFVGEAPGRDEDLQGEPFVGRAGQLLTKIIEAIGLTREQVYIANVIKCRPPENRNPEPDEVASCEPFLFRQIDAIKPKVIVALGTFAAHALLKTDQSISRLRGRPYQYRGAQLIATFHPAYLLRSPERKRDTWEDMKKVRALLQGDDE